LHRPLQEMQIYLETAYYLYIFVKLSTNVSLILHPCLLVMVVDHYSVIDCWLVEMCFLEGYTWRIIMPETCGRNYSVSTKCLDSSGSQGHLALCTCPIMQHGTRGAWNKRNLRVNTRILHLLIIILLVNDCFHVMM